jgi:nitroreductase
MMDAIRRRRSIRKYEQRPVEPELVAALEEAALRAPSSRNLRPCRFVSVTDRSLLARLSTSKASNAGFVSDAALAVVVCADSEASDCWIEDCSIAAAYVQLTATELGLGSCWVQIRGRAHADGRPAEEHVRENLSLPEDTRVLCLIAIGYPAEDKQPTPDHKLPWEKVTQR